ncbi:MAG: hypothetical protein HFH01_07270 [Dorea sp.]|nr:hypothetical protein [Dorea sp.]
MGKKHGIILELKINSMLKETIQQVKDRGYALRFKEKFGGKPKFTERILAVGISYEKKTKRHSCSVEVLS